MTKLLAVVVVLGVAVPVRSEAVLATAFAEACGAAVAARTVILEQEHAASRHMVAAFVPRICSVESWCLVKATDCFLGQMARPTGLWNAFAQYSVVRRVRALCPTGNDGSWERRTFMGPVEPQVFSSTIETSEAAAVFSALKLCNVYRADWVSAAPACRD